MFSTSDWSESQRNTVANLGGIAAVERMISDLSSYDRTQTVVRFEYDEQRKPLTPAQMKAWASLAESFGKDTTLDGQEIRRPKTHDELALTVVRNKLSRIQAEKWQAEHAAKKAAESE